VKLAVSTPRDLLLPYQERWVSDSSRFKIGLWSRQVGKDFCSGEEGIRDCITAGRRGEKINWLIVSPSERQSIEALSKWKEWAEAYKLAIEEQTEEREHGSESILKSASIDFASGCRVIAVPGNPDTVRGYSANLLLTEFAFFENPELTWRALVPSITNPIRGKKKIRVISSANGIGNKFHDLWVKNHGVTDANWSAHFVTIHDAIADGLQVDAKELRDSIDDPEGWAQEYECEFIDASGVLLTYAIIACCESHDATLSVPADYWEVSEGPPVDLGIDFARRKHLSVCWAIESPTPNLRLTREVLAMRDVSTPDQLDILRTRIRRARRVCLDYTGAGIGLGDMAVKEFGEYKPAQHKFGKIELCQASQPFNNEMYSKLRASMEHRSPLIPVDRVIREDLHSVYRHATQTGVSYRAPHASDGDYGHADRCYALGLANRASTLTMGHCEPDRIRIGGGGLFKRNFRPRRLMATR
jgi:phage FluMu gp28-like protein